MENNWKQWIGREVDDGRKGLLEVLNGREAKQIVHNLSGSIEENYVFIWGEEGSRVYTNYGTEEEFSRTYEIINGKLKRKVIE
ncbi:hypothetical protein HN832_02355 [archaeon]|jgi:hypothetical protein|nr:hypothetical protein [archaeon]MBT4373196.1 hypothetical protein [archaeon]MBT4531541.1 hypothetical protein [archaeon]MBT7001281.1 hypothetical protein [archaeon]MBT7282233.1 hypothetical protein [archaeon]